MKGVRALVAALGAALVPSSAIGQGATAVRYSVEYRAPEGCPSADEFQRGVESRAEHALRVDKADAVVELQVTLTRDEEHTIGVLLVTLSDGSSSARWVGDASCDAAVASLAVMSALVLDAEHRTAVEPEPEPATLPAAPPPGAPSTAPVRPERRPAQPEPPRGQGAQLDVTLRAHALWERAVAPGVPLGALVGGELGWSRPGVLSPALGVNGLVVLSQEATTSAGSASFRLVAARLGLCLLRLRAPLDASLRLCAEADAGALRGDAAPGVVNSDARTMPWLAAGVTVRGEVPLGGGIAVELGVGARALARHDRFYFRPGVPVHDVPPWSAAATLGLSYGL
jgi:hypothetical protein